MEIKEYIIIAISPLILVLCLPLICIFFGKTKIDKILENLIEYMFLNMFPDILKFKMDEEIVYIKNVKLSTQCPNHEKTIDRVFKVFGIISFLLILYLVLVFGQFTFIEYSYDCDVVGQGKDCFEYPNTAVRANCSDPDILKGKKLVVCYRLVFQFELATGVCYGIYKTCTMLLSVGSTLIININKNHIKRLKIVVGIIGSIIVTSVIVLEFTLKSHPFFRFTKMKLYLTITVGTAIMSFFIVLMPWEGIIEEKNRANTEAEAEHSATVESTVQSSQAGGTGQGSSVQEVGLDNPINPTSL